MPASPSPHKDLSVLLPPSRCLALCALISGVLLAGAFAFEHLGGLAPCSLCIWQRWAHVAIIAFALTGLGPLPSRVVLGLVFMAGAASAVIAGYHAGVELQLWQGPTGCSSTGAHTGSTSQIVDQLLATPIVRCDEVPWSFLGVSMAGWNTLFSIDISLIALASLVAHIKSRRTK